MFTSPAQQRRTVLLVTGGRNFAKPRALWRFLDRLARELNIVRVVAGECPTGADLFAKQWAEQHNVPYTGYPADWSDLTAKPCVKRYRSDGEPYNAAAGGVRNRRMLQQSKANLVVATPGASGTADMKKVARLAGVTVLELTP